MQQPATTITYMSLAALKPAARNPKEHATEDIEASVKRFGFVDPLIINATTGLMVAGHGRLEVLERMHAAGEAPPARVVVKKGEWFVPTVHVPFASEREAEAYLLASNRLVEKGGWSDDDTLYAMLSSIAGVESVEALYDADRRDDVTEALLGTGFDVEGMRRIVPVRGHERLLTDPDDVPPVPADPVTKTGDRIVLGNHVLVCGDSRELSTWELLLLADEQLNLVTTDPPYGVDYVGGNHNKSSKERLKSGALVVHGDGADELEATLARSLAQALARSRSGANWYVCGAAGPHAETFMRVMRELNVLRQLIIWVKDSLVMGRSEFHYRHEMIYFGWAPGTHRPLKDRKQDTVWEFDRPKRSGEHPTMKPVEMFEHMLDLSSDVGDIVGDPFAGSGTSLIAAELQGRRARCIELSPAYCDVIVKRWEDMTGEKARRP